MPDASVPGSRPRRGRSVEQVGEAASGRDHPRVVGADDLEELDQALAHGALAVGVELREQREQAVERVVDVSAREVEVGDVELRGQVVGR